MHTRYQLFSSSAPLFFLHYSILSTHLSAYTRLHLTNHRRCYVACIKFCRLEELAGSDHVSKGYTPHNTCGSSGGDDGGFFPRNVARSATVKQTCVRTFTSNSIYNDAYHAHSCLCWGQPPKNTATFLNLLLIFKNLKITKNMDTITKLHHKK